MSFLSRKATMPDANQALPGRQTAMAIPEKHFVLGTPLAPPYPSALEQAMFGMGCFWGAERRFWKIPGVYTTAVGYAGGLTPNPTYDEVCSGQTGHNEVVLVVFDPKTVSYQHLLNEFWESHDPTQGMRQGNDIGTQYRSGIYTFTDLHQLMAAESKTRYQEALVAAGRQGITSEIVPAPTFYFAEEYHQQYLAKNPNGYCGLGGTGVCMPGDESI